VTAFFVTPSERRDRDSRATAEDRQNERADDQALQGAIVSSSSPQGAILMASASVPGMHGWGNLYDPSLLGALGLSPRYRGGLRAPFLLGCGVADMTDHTIQRA
jgi:hypothetical protein